MKKIAAVAVAAALGLAGVVVSASPALAVPTDVACATVTGRGSATSYRWIQVTNTCVGPISVKLDINNANDSGCYVIDKYDTEKLRYNRLYGTFRAIIDC